MFKSATRIVLLLLVLTLCVLVFKTINNQEQFSLVFELFKATLSGVVGFFIAKSTQESLTAKEPINYNSER